MNFIRYCDYCVDDTLLIEGDEDTPLWVIKSELVNLDHVHHMRLGGDNTGGWFIHFELSEDKFVRWPYKTEKQAMEAYIKLVKNITGATYQ